MEWPYLAVVVAVVCRSLAVEEVFREPRDWLRAAHARCRERMGRTRGALACAGWWAAAKATYLLTCEFCSSFWVALAVVAAFDAGLAYPGTRGRALCAFVTMGAANVYMAAFSLLRVAVARVRPPAPAAKPPAAL